MSAVILDGKALATQIKQELALRVAVLKEKESRQDLEQFLLAMTPVHIPTLVANIVIAKKLESNQYA